MKQERLWPFHLMVAMHDNIVLLYEEPQSLSISRGKAPMTMSMTKTIFAEKSW